MSLFAAVDATGALRLINHLGIELGGTAEEILARVEAGTFSETDVREGAAASDREYATHVRDVDANTPARFNADTRGLFEASGCAGKLMVFAVRLDTFPAERGAKVFYIGSNAVDVLTAIRRHALAKFKHLPIAGEYIHRDAFDVAKRYGKDLFVILDKLGTSRLPRFFDLKTRADAWFERLPFMPKHLIDRALQWLSERLPDHLPKRLSDYRDRYEHHLMIKVPNGGGERNSSLSHGMLRTRGRCFFRVHGR